jgi:hypothetical protein
MLVEREVDGDAPRVRGRVTHAAHARPAAGDAQQRLLNDVLGGRGITHDQVDHLQQRLTELIDETVKLLTRAAHQPYNP